MLISGMHTSTASFIFRPNVVACRTACRRRARTCSTRGTDSARARHAAQARHSRACQPSPRVGFGQNRPGNRDPKPLGRGQERPGREARGADFARGRGARGASQRGAPANPGALLPSPVGCRATARRKSQNVSSSSSAQASSESCFGRTAKEDPPFCRGRGRAAGRHPRGWH